MEIQAIIFKKSQKQYLAHQKNTLNKCGIVCYMKTLESTLYKPSSSESNIIRQNNPAEPCVKQTKRQSRKALEINLFLKILL
jgi:hypothetical protein